MWNFSEIMNLRNLERVLAREEEVKKKAVINKAKYDGPEIRFYSRDGTLFSFVFYIYLSYMILIEENIPQA